MSKILFLNGEYLSNDAARVDPNDRGLLLGDGLFETIRCYQGQPIALEAHWKRLSTGASVLKIHPPLTCQALYEHVSHLLSINQLEQSDAGVRLTITRGAGQRGLSPPAEVKPMVLMTCFAIPALKKPVSVMLSNMIVNEHSPLTAFKTLAYADNIIAYQEAIEEGFDDALLRNTKGHIVSASSANLFLVINKKLHTPALTCGALPGVTRQQVLMLAEQRQIPVVERPITADDLQAADEAFLTNSIVSLLPIKSFGSQPLKMPAPGPLTMQLSHAWKQLITP